MQTRLDEEAARSLLLAHAHPKIDDHVLILEGGHGWLAGEAAALVPAGQVSSHDRDIRHVEAARQTLEAHPNATSENHPLPDRGGWDLVLINMPKERSYARLLLITAFQVLKEGGELLLAGPTRAGAKAVIKDAQRLFGNCILLDYRSHQRIARFSRQGPLPAQLPEEFQVPGISPGTSRTLEITTAKGSLSLQTSPGIFSWEKLDRGSEMLLAHIEVEPGSLVWDVGCGYGVLGLSAALAGAGLVWMNDVNTLAVDSAQRNAANNQLAKKVRIYAAAGLTLPQNGESPTRFDLILSNPAFHQGRVVDSSMADKMIAEAETVLKPGGRLVLVANRFLNYNKSLQSVCKKVRKLAEDNHYHIIEGRF